MTKKQRKMLLRILLAFALLVILAFIPSSGWIRLGLYMIPYLIIGHDILRKAFLGIRNKRVFDENFLMAVATVGAIVLAVTDSGDYLEAIAVMLFYQVGELFQSYAVGKSRRSIASLMDIRPDYANVIRDGQLIQLDPEEIAVGTEIVVQPGERVPLDGLILTGFSALDTAALTGESLPRDIAPGDRVISGCINLTGLLTVRTTSEFTDSTVARILDLVENASSRKSRSEDFISKFARVYTPIVCISALVLAVLPPLCSLLLGADPAFGTWAYRALTFLIISCPCALVVSVPLSFFAGIGGASREGILIKGSNFMETLSKVKTVVFDKTGTLTQGVFAVTGITSQGISREMLLEYAALAESASSHPISKSLRQACGKPLDRSRVENIRERSGKGITAQVDGKSVAVGNRQLMQELGLEVPHTDAAGTTVYVALDGLYAGHIHIADSIKPGAEAAISALRKAGVTHTVMLTGDSCAAADRVARQLGIREVHSQLLPIDKVGQVEVLLSQKHPAHRLAFVGDGINDAPVLSRSDIGIAMGAMGSDAAIEAADIVLMDDDPMKIPKAIRISRKCIGIVYQNIVFAIGVKVLCLALGALGISNMWFAIFADVGVAVLAILNATRSLNTRNL